MPFPLPDVFKMWHGREINEAISDAMKQLMEEMLNQFGNITRGPTGPTGPQGPMGATGPTGP